jgi:hypothetical protein
VAVKGEVRVRLIDEDEWWYELTHLHGGGLPSKQHVWALCWHSHDRWCYTVGVMFNKD